MKLLITGITGRVGANVAQKFLQNGHDVRGFVWPGDRLRYEAAITDRDSYGLTRFIAT